MKAYHKGMGKVLEPRGLRNGWASRDWNWLTENYREPRG